MRRQTARKSRRESTRFSTSSSRILDSELSNSTNRTLNELPQNFIRQRNERENNSPITITSHSDESTKVSDRGSPTHPATRNTCLDYSDLQFDALIKKWNQDSSHGSMSPSQYKENNRRTLDYSRLVRLNNQQLRQSAPATYYPKTSDSTSDASTICSIQDVGQSFLRLPMVGEKSLSSQPDEWTKDRGSSKCLATEYSVSKIVPIQNVPPRIFGSELGGSANQTFQGLEQNFKKLVSKEENTPTITIASEPDELESSIDAGISPHAATECTLPDIFDPLFTAACEDKLSDWSHGSSAPSHDVENIHRINSSSESTGSTNALDNSSDNQPHNSPTTLQTPSNILPLTEPPTFSTIEEELSWLNKQREVGLFIICNHKKCGKLRYQKDCHDPTEVPEVWECSSEPGRSCDDPEEPIPEDEKKHLIENCYNAGSLVWAKCGSYPWWPAIVCDDPEIMAYYELRENSCIPEKYHVIYFEYKGQKTFQYDWLELKNLKPFNPDKTPLKDMMEENENVSVRLMKRKRRAYEVCKRIYNSKMSISERLDKHGYMAVLRLKKNTNRKRKRSLNVEETKSQGKKRFKRK